MPLPDSGGLRIGAFSDRVGVPATVLRAWEARYGLFTPSRTSGGFRLYGPEEERRVRAMRAQLALGFAARESARLVLAESTGADHETALAELASAWQRFEAFAAHRALDTLLGGPAPEVRAWLDILPLLRELGAEHRHFARRLTETRLLALCAGWHEGAGQVAVVGCGAGEHETLPLIVFALALHRLGRRIVYLGADTPVDAFVRAAEAVSAAQVFVGVTRPQAAPRLGAAAVTLISPSDDPLLAAATAARPVRARQSTGGS